MGVLSNGVGQLVPTQAQVRSLPRRRWWGFGVRFVKTFEVLLFKALQLLGIYRPQKSILGVPSLASSKWIWLQALVYNGTQEEVLGFKPRRLLHRILKGFPDVEMFERVKFQLTVSQNDKQTFEGSTETRGFITLQSPNRFLTETPSTSWLRIEPKGVDTLFGTVKLGDYEVVGSPVFFLNEKIKWVVVSDIDDTIKDSKISETASIGHVLSGLFRGHYYKYDAIKGMAQLYRSIAAKNGLIIYLTSTPYQLAPFLLKFLKESGFPEGPVFLRWLGYGKVRHKWKALLKILGNLESHQRCIFFGDSGERDPQIYHRIIENTNYSDKVEKILIRHVPGTPIQIPLDPREKFYNEISELPGHLDFILGEKPSSD